MRTLLAALATAFGLCILSPGPAPAGVYHSRESALELAFPGADSVAVRDLTLSRDDVRRIRELSGVQPESRLVTVYAGYRGGQVAGWAFIDTHPVRTLPETLLLVLTPAGEITGTHLLAFHEPPEYEPPAAWWESWKGEHLDSGLSLRGRVDSLSGSTISAQTVTACVRRLLAVWQVKIAADAPAETAMLP